MGKNTGPEISLRKALRGVGLSGYRLHWKEAPGRPDIAYPGKRIAIFVHGCFWHRCPKCDMPLPKSHTDFWRSKFERNRARDEQKIKALKRSDWTLFIVWECEINKDALSVARRIKRSKVFSTK